jgi:hypothetical protein
VILGFCLLSGTLDNGRWCFCLLRVVGMHGMEGLEEHELDVQAVLDCRQDGPADRIVYEHGDELLGIMMMGRTRGRLPQEDSLP